MELTAELLEGICRDAKTRRQLDHVDHPSILSREQALPTVEKQKMVPEGFAAVASSAELLREGVDCAVNGWRLQVSALPARQRFGLPRLIPGPSHGGDYLFTGDVDL